MVSNRTKHHIVLSFSVTHKIFSCWEYPIDKVLLFFRWMSCFPVKYSMVRLRCDIIWPGHCVKLVQVRSFFWSVFSPNEGKYGSEKTRYLDTFRAVGTNAYFFSLVLWDYISRTMYCFSEYPTSTVGFFKIVEVMLFRCFDFMFLP